MHDQSQPNTWVKPKTVPRVAVSLPAINIEQKEGMAIMPRYEIEQYEIHLLRYGVDAPSEAHAIGRLLTGEGVPIDGSAEFIEVCQDRGLPVAKHSELADDLRELGIAIQREVIPSIRSIKKIA